MGLRGEDLENMDMVMVMDTDIQKKEMIKAIGEKFLKEGNQYNYSILFAQLQFKCN